jgi:two-component system phosphate regulon sensor histidine kinase PhoR
MKKTRKLVWHIYFSYGFIIILVLLVVTLYASHSLKQFHLEKIRERLEANARHFSTLVEADISPEDGQKVDNLCKSVGQQLSNRFTVTLPSGLVIGDSMEDPARMDNHKNRPEIRKAFSGDIGVSTRFSNTLKQEMMYVAIPVRKGEDTIGVVRASMSVSVIKQSLNGMYREIAFIGIFVAILAAIISLVVSYRITRPLEEMRKGAIRFAYGDLHHRIYVSESHEIGTLAETINQMAAQLEERIQTVTRQRNELEAVLTSMTEAVVIVDQEERVIRCNQAAGRIFGFNPETIGDRSIQELIRNASIQRFVRKIFESDTPVEDVIALNASNERFLHTYGTLLQEATDQTPVALLVFHDITRLKQLENIRREFVANVSHELKTPITSIEGFIETLQEGAINDPENAAKFLKIIERNAHRLNAIIEDLLTLSKIEQEEEEKQILLREGSIKDVLNAAVMVCANTAQEKHVTVEVQCPDEIRACMNRDLLVQAVVNLLDNAIKYSDPESFVNVSAVQSDHEVVLAVEDSGCGIPKEHLPRIFERFYRVDKARSRKIGGTGLGLAIVKHIANAHRGCATVESIPGQGSRFSIIIPAY